jgi:hypothetical protein
MAGKSGLEAQAHGARVPDILKALRRSNMYRSSEALILGRTTSAHVGKASLRRPNCRRRRVLLKASERVTPDLCR